MILLFIACKQAVADTRFKQIVTFAFFCVHFFNVFLFLISEISRETCHEYVL